MEHVQVPVLFRERAGVLVQLPLRSLQKILIIMEGEASVGLQAVVDEVGQDP